MSDFPAWFYGPAGKAQIFECAEDVPTGWADAPGNAPTHRIDGDRSGDKGGSLPKKRGRR